MQGLIKEGSVEAQGSGRGRAYTLKVLRGDSFSLDTEGLQEDRVWMERVEPLLSNLPENVRSICNHGFTEMLNNAIDHSGSRDVHILVIVTAMKVLIEVTDHGMGIFRKLMAYFHLDDERQAMLELSKGRLTTDPARHSGEGIFFTSKMFDKFIIVSGHFSYFVNRRGGETLFEEAKDGPPGTSVVMIVDPASPRTTKEVFDAYAPEENDWTFSRTVVPIYLARYEGSDLISRSQAKRIMARVEQFKSVVLDFEQVEMVGQAFSDEIFRVWQNSHPDVEMMCANANAQVLGMVNRARQAAGLPIMESIDLDH